jgi:hypothetical protein
VISWVCLSISLSSAVRSVKPGRTCFACSLSSTVTTISEKQVVLGTTLLTLVAYSTEDLFDFITDIDPKSQLDSSNSVGDIPFRR